MTEIIHRFMNLRPLLLLTTLILTGCQANGPGRYTPPVKKINMVSQVSSYEGVTDNMGMVVARIVHAGGVLPTLNFMTLTPKNYNTSDSVLKQRLEAASEDMERSNYFAGKIQPGTYSLSSMRAFYTFGYSYFSQFVPLDANYGTFEVKAGQVTDLGVLVYYPKPQEDKFVHTLLRLDAPQPGQLVSQQFPNYKFDPQAVLGWLEDDKADQRYEQYLATVQNPVSFNHRFKASDGSVYFLSGLGVMLKRSSDGEWSMDAVETNFKLNSMAESANGDLLVGGDGGQVFYKPLQGQWRDISIDPKMDVDNVNFRGNVVEVAAVGTKTVDFFQADLNQTDSEGFINWRKIISYSGSRGWLDIKGDRLQLPGIKQKLKNRLVEIVSVDNDATTNRVTIATKTKSNHQWEMGSVSFDYDVDSSQGNWQVTNKLEETEVTTQFDAGTVTMGIRPAGFWSWDGKPDYLIGNKNADEWSEMATKYLSCPRAHYYKEARCYPIKDDKKGSKAPRTPFYFVSPPMFFTTTDGVAIVKDKSRNNRRDDEQKKPARMLMTNDGGQSWLLTDNKLPTEYCYKLEVLVTDRLLLSCDGSSGDFYESTDRGKTWSHTREHQSF